MGCAAVGRHDDEHLLQITWSGESHCIEVSEQGLEHAAGVVSGGLQRSKMKKELKMVY